MPRLELSSHHTTLQLFFRLTLVHSRIQGPFNCSDFALLTGFNLKIFIPREGCEIFTKPTLIELIDFIHPSNSIDNILINSNAQAWKLFWNLLILIIGCWKPANGPSPRPGGSANSSKLVAIINVFQFPYKLL